MPLQRRHLFDIVISMVEEGSEDSEIYNKADDVVFHLLLPYLPTGYDASSPLVDYSQLLTEIYEN